MNHAIEINSEYIGENYPVYFIAEAGINHNGDVNTAENLIQAAAKTGANAVKFQTYITEKRVPGDSPIFDILKKCELSFQDQRKLKAVAENEGVTFFSTPFDTESVNFLADLDIASYKIASFELVNLALVRKVAGVQKPVIASRGMANRDEIDRAVQILKDNGVPYALLHCVSSYPAAIENANLKVINSLLNYYDCPVGYSDHTLGIKAPTYAIAAGAKIIEKHFTLDKRMDGPDHSMSADPQEMTEMINECKKVESILGKSDICMSDAEAQFTWLRRPTE